ncbi:MAG: hypothetical protein ACPKM0_08560 [Pleomorphochaeta sp.]
MKKILTLLLIFTLVPTFVFADNFDSLFEDSSVIEDDSLFSNDDDLFGSDDLFSDDSVFSSESSSETSTSSVSLFDDLLTSDVEITGSYYFNFETGLNYNFDTQADPTYYSASDVSADIQLSARPSTDTRFYAEATITYPFSVEETTTYTTSNSETVSIVDTYNNININELFYDFVIDDYFVRVGKQTLNMGVGYFYSPANLLNISTINPLDAEADQEGPLAIKVNKPLGNDNLYAYVTLPEETNYSPSDISYAARYETVVGGAEYTLSGYYNYDIDEDPTKVAFTMSSPLFTDIDLIAEVVESYDGTDFTFEGTAGISVLKEFEDLSDTSLSFIAQYYYAQDGETYFKIDDNFVTLNSTQQIAAVLSLSTAYDLSFSITSINLLDESTGFLIGNIGYDVSDDISIDFGAQYIYGLMNTIKPYIGFTLGQGDF